MTPERRMTEKKKEAARLNGAKSRGPVTAEGKARSSQNAVTHGLLSNTILLPGESEQQFQQLLDSLIQAYRPQTDAEARLVEQIAAVTWFQLRLLGIETQTLATRMELQAQVLDAHVADLTPSRRIALAYAELADTSRVPANLDRHSTRLGRQLDRLHNQLIRLQALHSSDPGTGPHQSDSDSSLPSPDSSTKFPNEPTSEQPITNEQRTNPEMVPGTSVTRSALHTPGAEPASSHSDSCLRSPDSPNKFPNEPTGEQTNPNQLCTNPETASDSDSCLLSPDFSRQPQIVRGDRLCRPCVG